MKTKSLRPALKLSTTPRLILVPPTTYLVVEGSGSPEGPAFERAIGGLYSVAWTLKMELRNEGKDFKISPLEALWWTPEGKDFVTASKTSWKWKALMAVPRDIDAQLVTLVKASLVNKRGRLEAADVYLEQIDEGTCVQALNIGPYSAEQATIEAMRDYMDRMHVRPHGPHHEIYISDPRRTAPERLRTLIRQPVVTAA